MKIASFSGGGEKGLIGLAVIDYIEHSTGKHAAELFDGFAGTSTGAITALALAKKDPLWASELIKLYMDDAAKIFPGGFWRSLQSVFSLKGDKYPVAGLEALLKDVFGNTLMTDLAKPVCITTVDATNLQTRVLTERDLWYVWEAARASSAGPSFFAPYVRGTTAYVDGGVTVNCPDMEAIDLWDLWKDSPNQLMLSLGTGVQVEGWKPVELSNIGELRWASKVITMALDGVTRETVRQVRDQYVRGNYLRLDADLSNDLGDMDQSDPAKLKRLHELGITAVAASKPELDAFIKRLQ